MRVVHVHTGEHAVADAIDRWLERHGIEPVRCADAFEACSYLVQHASSPPALAFVGLDWLDRDDADILRYIHDTWAESVIVTYGRGRSIVNCGEATRTIFCPTRAALNELISQPPDDLVRRLGAPSQAEPSNAESAVRPAPPDSEKQNAARGMALGEYTSGAGETATLPAVNPQTLPGEAASDSLRDRSRTPRAILTREELSALLEGAGN